jgi:hypothetical protein
MKPTPHDEMQLTEWLFRFGPAVLAWVAVIGFFAFAGSVADDAPRQMAHAAPAVGMMDDEVAPVTSLVLGEASRREPEPRDAAVIAHEALDPVGAGHSPTP